MVKGGLVPLAIVGEADPSGNAGLFRFKVVGEFDSVNSAEGEGRAVGTTAGILDGSLLGSVDGSNVTKGGDWKMLGIFEGAPVGQVVGISLSSTVGFMEISIGALEAMVGASDGLLVGMIVGTLVIPVGSSE